MNILLTQQEKRRIEFAQLLSYTDQPLLLSDLAKEIGCSSRVLKEDIIFLNNNYNDFNITTSKKGVKLKYYTNSGPKTFIREFFNQSSVFLLLETIFLNESKSVQDIADIMFISRSTLYRMINQVNKKIKDGYNFYVETNPCRIVGNEKNIRYFFYNYFSEKYINYSWSETIINEKKLVELIELFFDILKISEDFISFNDTKLVTIVNHIRYSNGHTIEEQSDDDIIQLFLKAVKVEYSLNIVDKKNTVEINEKYIQQVFTSYLQKGIIFNKKHFKKIKKEDEKVSKKVRLLKKMFGSLSIKYNIDLPNLEEILISFINAIHLEFQDIQSGYILYDRNQFFAKDIKNEFADFYQDMYFNMKEFRQEIGKPMTESGVNFYIYTLFSRWENLVLELRKKIGKISVLIISDRHKKHGEMLKDFIKYEFNNQLEISFYHNIEYDVAFIKKLNYDLIISSVAFKGFEDMNYVYISNVPKSKDYLIIKEAIDSVISKGLNINYKNLS